jgi:hypothetical protein
MLPDKRGDKNVQEEEPSLRFGCVLEFLRDYKWVVLSHWWLVVNYEVGTLYLGRCRTINFAVFAARTLSVVGVCMCVCLTSILCIMCTSFI